MKRLLTFMLTFAMLATMVIVPVSAVTDTTSGRRTILNADYDTPETTPAFVTGNYSRYKIDQTADTYFGSKGAQLYSWSEKPIISHTFERQSSGKMYISFDFYMDTLTSPQNQTAYSRFMLADSSIEGNNSGSASGIEDNYFTLLKVFPNGYATMATDDGSVAPLLSNGYDSNVVGSGKKVEAKTVYHYECEVDLDKHSISGKLTNKDTKDVIGEATRTNILSNTRSYTDWPSTAKGFDRIGLMSRMDSYNTHIDNLKIEVKEKDPNVLIEKLTFDSDADKPNKNASTNYELSDGVFGLTGSMYSFPTGWTFEKQTSGKIKVAFDFMSKEKVTKENHIMLTQSTTTDGFSSNNLSILAYKNKDVMQVGVAQDVNSNGNIGQTVPGTWYSYVGEVDLDNQSISAAVSVKTPASGSSEVAGSLVGSTTVSSAGGGRYGYPTGATGFDTFAFVGAMVGGICIDNLEIKKCDKNLILDDDFSNIANTAFHLKNDTGVPYKVADSTLTRPVNSENNSAYNNSFGLRFAGQNDGKLRLEFDFKLSDYAEGAIVGLGSSNGTYNDAKFTVPVLRMQNTKDTEGKSTMSVATFGNTAGAIPKPDLNKWYTVKSEVNLSKKIITTSVYDNETLFGSETTAVLSNHNSLWTGWSASDVDAYDLLVTNGGVSSKVALDNVKVWHYADDISVSAEKIKVKNIAGVEQNEWTAISPVISKIEIDLGAAAKESTITKDNIYIESTGDEKTKFDITPAYSDGVVTLTFPPGTNLGSEKTYKLCIKKAVANVDGTELDKDYDFTFVTEKANVSLTYGDVAADGNNVTVPVSYVNTNAQVVKPQFIVAYYKDDVMVKCDLIDTYSLNANTLSGSFDFTYTKDSTVEASSIKLFAWNDLTNISAVSEVKGL